MKDDKMDIITNDIERIRTRPTMIVGFVGSKGILHLCKEIINNNADECFKKESPGDSIHIEIDHDHIMSEDNGRGLPTNLLRTIHETSNAGSNMTRAHGASAGENGIGTTAFTALSSDLIVTTFRPQEKKKLTLHYKEGKLVDEKLEPYKDKHHGLQTYFKPSKKIMGESEIPVPDLVQWIKGFEYTLDPSIKVSYTVNGNEYKITHKTVDQFFKEIIPQDKFLSQPIMIECDGKLTELVKGEAYDRMFHVEASFMYASPDYRGEDIRQSWMNMIETAAGGSHINGVISGLSKYLAERAIAKKKALEDDDLRRDILLHLNVVVKADCDFANIFASQEKSKVDSRALATAIANAVYQKLSDMNQTRLNELVEIVIQNNRVRKEGEKARNLASESKKKQWVIPDSYLPCSSVKTPQPKELYLVEGNSAAGGINVARNAKFQAVLMFRGKSLNVWDLTIDQALKSNVWYDLVRVLECGIGSTFDMKRLKFDKIVISTDADIDGFHIRVEQCSFFLKFFPEIIEAGKLYIAEPPLYKLVSGKRVSYVTTQTDYINACIDSVGNISLTFPEGVVQKASGRTFITEAFTYLSDLIDLSLDLSVNRNLLEHIAYGMMQAGSLDAFLNNIDNWCVESLKVFPELGFDPKSHQILATIDLTDQVVVIDQTLFDRLQPIIEIQRKYGLHVIYDTNTTTIAQFFENIQKNYPVIKDRYKGLGSSDPKVLREIIMDPKTRRIFRVDASDIHIMQTYDMLVGKSKEATRRRKEMITSFKWKPSDIDT
jgi:DNA gyrase/topoisomerase IV subunit B